MTSDLPKWCVYAPHTHRSDPAKGMVRTYVHTPRGVRTICTHQIGDVR